MPFVVDCRVLKNEEVAPDHYSMAVTAPEIAREAVAGQFCMLQVSQGYYPFLRRPMSFERIFIDGVSFLYKIEGEGTRILSTFAPDQEISIQGPLGNGFKVDSGFSRHIIVAGGIGIAPCPALAEKIIREHGKAPEVIIGARTQDMILCEKQFHRMGCKVILATDDGSVGEKCFAHQVLETLSPGNDTCVYVCGPMVMMKATSQVAKNTGAGCYVSLEAQMACGDGACLGCVVESNLESDGEKMVRVCADGPVFDSTIIDWEAHNLAFDR